VDFREDKMKLTVYGARGSAAAPSIKSRGFDTSIYGGNTTCYYVETDDGQKLIFDAGTGIIPLGKDLDEKGLAGEETHIFITHTHWDHIQGFPFFGHQYNPANNITLYGQAKVEGDLIKALNGHPGYPGLYALKVNGEGIERVLNNQQGFRNFPVPLGKGVKGFVDIIPGGIFYENNGVSIESTALNHPGECLSYKIRERKPDGNIATVVISTDFEPDFNGEDQKIIEWWANAELVLADSQYERNSEINPFNKGWGHSDIMYNIDLAKNAEVHKLVGIHHEPKRDDTYHADLEHRAIMYSREHTKGNLEVSLAKEGETYKI
jgi:phosphoribosyl 1,2-cyclic phosphodiesterase